MYQTLIQLFLIAGVVWPTGGAIQGPVYDDTPHPEFLNPSWMSGLPDSSLLSEVTMPGTHNTMAVFGGALAECQSWSLGSQLRAGVRFLDVRVRHVKGNLTIHHGVSYQRAHFGHVLQGVVDFLDEYPSETVLMRVKEELSETYDIYGAVVSYVHRYASWDMLWHSRLMPTMGQARGKLIILQDFHGPDLGMRYGSLDIADDWKVPSLLQVPRGKPMAKRVLVVAPGSLVQNWGAEFNKWLGRERISVYAVDQDHRIEQFVASPLHSVLVISYEMLLRSLEQVQKLEFGLIVCDEGHRLKNSSIKTSSAISGLSCRRRVILTGTPVQNDLQEFYAIIELVNPGILGSCAAYRKVFEEPILRSRQPSCTEEERVLGEERATELSRLTSMFVLRRTQEIINCYLPPRHDWTLFCGATALQTELYQQLLAHRVFRACLQGSGQTHTHLACITALKKLCNHPGLLHATVKAKADSGSVENTLYEGLAALFPEDYSSGGLSTADSGKLLVLADLLTAIRHLSPSDRVVVVSNYTQTLDLLQDLCVHMDYTFCRLDGQTPTNQRQRLVDNFNSPYSNHFLFLLSSKAGGVGLNLVGASHLVLYDIDWNPANDIQAMARVWRDGQKKTVHIYRLLTAGTIEERIFQRQVSKQGLSGTVVDLGKGAEHTSFSTSELRDLFSLADTPSLTHDLLNCNCSMDGTIPAMEEEVEQRPDRPCQLGRLGDRVGEGGVSQKHLSMSELMQWRHFSGETTTFSDPYLDHARNHITFAFQSTMSHAAQ